jgi:long-chain acyl-CoA synthetase
MVENAICQHPAVAECVVVGIHKHTVNESVKAFIRYKNDVTPPTSEQMQDFLKDKLNRMEIPRVFEVRTEELPKTSVGKPDWKKLEDEETAKTKAATPSFPKPY